MAVKFQPWLLLLYLLISVIPFSSCQPRNIETVYPFDTPPSPAPSPSITNDPPIIAPLPPPRSPQLVPPPPSLSAPQSGSPSDDKTIAKAVAATAASTLFIAVLFFFALQRYVVRKRQRVGDGDHNNSNEGRSPNELTRFDGNLRGLIVDENGLDVIYWRKLEEGDKRKGFDREILRSPRHEEEKEQEMSIKKFEAIQEVPLLRGKSSSSHVSVQPEYDDVDHIINSKPTPTPTPAPSVLKTIQEKQPSIQKSNVPPTPPPIQNNKSTAPPPPPPPPVPAKKNPAPPPPPPSILKPPPVPKRSSSEGQIKDSSAVAGNENGHVKLKPLHWDKVNKNVGHSMVWDKIDGGSFR